MTSGTEIPNLRRFRVAGRLVEADLNRLWRNGVLVPVEPQVIEVLCYLAARPGAVVSKEELLREVWGGRAVTEHVLTRAVKQLRDALGDDSHDPRVIETISRRGYRVLASVEPMTDDSARLDPESPWRPSVRVGLAAVSLAAVALVTAWTLWNPGRASPLPVRAVTVFPFQVLSAVDSAAPFSEGLAEVLVGDLSRIEGLSVIARGSASSGALEGLSLQEVGARLGVDAVIQGSMQGDEDGLRVDMRLVRTRDGRVLWSDVVRGGADNLLALHEQAAARLTAAVRGSPTPARDAAATTSREAYREYLFGRHHWNRRTIEDLGRAVAHFESALELDPRFAHAYAALAQVHVLLPFYGAAAPHEAMPRARLAAERALELDPQLASAHAVLAQILHEYEWDPDGADAAFRRAIALDPGDSTARQWYAEFLLVREQVEASRRQVELAIELDPLSPIVYLLPVGPYLWEGRYEEAAAVARRALEIEPRFAQAQNLLGLSELYAGRPEEAIVALESALPDLSIGFVGARLGCAYAALGRHEEARAVLEAILAESQTRYVSPFAIAALQLGLGDVDEAMASLERAYAERDGRLLYLNVDRSFDPLRDTPLFVDLVRRVGLPKPGRAAG